jgi:plastocyanin
MKTYLSLIGSNRARPIAPGFARRWLFLVASLLFFAAAFSARAQTVWSATVGAETTSKGGQALAFLPNEIWIRAGDSITWTFNTDEIHTVTFLTPDQVRPALGDGCPGFSSNPATYDGSTCVTTPPMTTGSTFTVMFPKVGNYKLVCLVHESMTGSIHVLAKSAKLPHDQAFYNQQAVQQQHTLLSEVQSLSTKGLKCNSCQDVAAGAGAIRVTSGGAQSISFLRFSNDNITIHAGQTVEWSNLDPRTPHTVTFGPPPEDIVDPSSDVTVDRDGARHAIISSTTDSTHSGFIAAAPEDRVGLPQAPLGVTRFRVTFPNAGTFPYMCVLHGDLGMAGEVVVSP